MDPSDIQTEGRAARDAETLRRGGSASEARKVAEEGLRCDETPALRIALGLALLDLGDEVAARGELERAFAPEIGPYSITSIVPVVAFDVDRRKVGRPLEEAVFAAPNCAQLFHPKVPSYGIRVDMGPPLDGVAPHMADYPEERAFRLSDARPVDVARRLRESGAEVLVSYLPVGSDKASRCYAEACLEAGVALVNCMPVFIASDPAWAGRFKDAGLPVVDDPATRTRSASRCW